MKPLTIALLLLPLIGGAGKMTFAEDKTPNLIITGTVTTDSCVVDTDSQNLKVPLGEVVTGQFVRAGDTSLPGSTFVIKLTDCDAGVKGAMITFSGNADPDNPDLLQISQTADSATGIGVAVIDRATGDNVPLGKATATAALTTGENTLSYTLLYQATRDTVTAGSANAVMYFDIAYQ